MVGGHTSAGALPKPIGSCMRKIKSEDSWWCFPYDKYNAKSIDFTFLQPKVLFIIQFNCQNLTPNQYANMQLSSETSRRHKKRNRFYIYILLWKFMKDIAVNVFFKKTLPNEI